MKKLFTIVAALLIHSVLVAVTPPVSDKISYQAVIRNASNVLVTNQPVGMKISILQGSATGIPMYGETHTVTTNANGLISIAIGTGTPFINAFTDVDWSAGPYFIKTETDPAGGTNYTITATSELLSVPYALYAGGANQLKLPYLGLVENSIPGFSVSNLGGTAISGTSDKPEGTTYGVIGKTISTEGTGVYGLSTSIAGKNYGVLGEGRGLYSIGVKGLTITSSGLNAGVMGVSASSEGYGVYGENTSTTGQTIGVFGEAISPNGYGVVGRATSTTGSATGVWGLSKALHGTGVLGESKYIGVRGINLSTTGFAYGVQGEVHSPDGIAVMGYSSSVTGSSTGIKGHVNSPNGFSGYFVGGKFYIMGKIGVNTESPEYDLDIIKQTGFAGLRLKSNNDGVLMTLDQVNDDNNGHYSFILFRKAGNNLFTVGTAYSEFRIYNSNDKGLLVKSTGDLSITNNLLMNVGKKIGIGTNTPGAGIHLKGTGFPDTFMFLEAATGNDAGFRIYEGATAKWHIFNDVNAGGLRMYNTAATTAIFLKQSNSFVGINTTTPNYNLEVNGTAGKTGGGSWSTSSDIRLKDVTGNYTKGLKEITALQPVSFVYKAGNARHLPGNVPQIGFVAQEVQKVFPEAVTKGNDGYLDFNIHTINVALVNAVKELKTENERLKAENNQLKMITDKNEARLTEVENKLQMLMKTN